MTVGIVGLGLIGGSVGLALREPGRRVIGCDAKPEHEKIAIDRGCVDEIVLLEEVAKADLVFVAAPPRAVPAILRELFDRKPPATVVTDCASVKAEILSWVREYAPKERNFVGGHPMAGHEKSGPAFASGWMYRGARWLLSPSKTTSRQALKLVEDTVKAMGAVPVRVDAEIHDRHVAVLSHLPHVLAGSLVQMGAELDRTDVGAGSWRDLTRVGGVDAGLWTEILMGNRRQVSIALKEFEEKLAEVRRSLDEDDAESIREFFERARIAKTREEP